MKLKIFSVFDSKVSAYLPPLCMRTTPEAIRGFSAAVADQSHQFSKHAEDYTLFEVGSWDDQTAAIDLLPTPHPVAKAIEFVNSKES